MNVYFKWSRTTIKLFPLQGDCNSDIICKALQMEEESPIVMPAVGQTNIKSNCTANVHKPHQFPAGRAQSPPSIPCW